MYTYMNLRVGRQGAPQQRRDRQQLMRLADLLIE